MHAKVLKFHIYISHEKIAATCFFFLLGLFPFPEFWPFEKNMDEVLSAKYLKKLLKLEPWNLRNRLVAMSR